MKLKLLIVSLIFLIGCKATISDYKYVGIVKDIRPSIITWPTILGNGQQSVLAIETGTGTFMTPGLHVDDISVGDSLFKLYRGGWDKRYYITGNESNRYYFLWRNYGCTTLKQDSL